MNEQTNFQAQPGGTRPFVPTKPFHPSGRREWGLMTALCVITLLLSNAIISGGFNLGFAVGAALVLSVSFLYMLQSGGKPTLYTVTLWVLGVAIAASFARSNDYFVKFVLFWFLLAAANLCLCITAGQAIYPTGGVGSLIDGLRSVFTFSLGAMPRSFRGLRYSGTGGKRIRTDLLLGLALSVPVLAILLPLLKSADAAFSGLLEHLPDIRWGEIFLTAVFAAMLLPVLYARAVALMKEPKEIKRSACARRWLPGVTVTTVLTAVCIVYALYLLSQMAYFTDAFSGLLPKGFTAAQYARRGFFEMAAICCVNLGLIVLARALSGGLRGVSRLLCLFIGIVTLFLVFSAGSRMWLYIQSFGLTRLRVLTSVIMVFAGLTTAVVCLWLFAPRLPYMKVVIVLALALGCAVCWVDVDTQVARYNVEAYRAGRLETVDVAHLQELSGGAVVYLAQLLDDSDPQIASQARDTLRDMGVDYGVLEWAYEDTSDSKYREFVRCLPKMKTDLRGWSYTEAQAYELLYRLAQGGMLNIAS